MKKKVFVLRTPDYRPDLCRFTIPTIKAYAAKIGAEYHEITDRQHPELPITFEKLRIYYYGSKSDWNLLIDADIMIRPDLPDVTQYLPPNAVATAFGFDASTMFEPNRFFLRDGRNIGLVGNFVVVPKLVHEVWNFKEAMYPEDLEEKPLSTWTRRDFIIDEYVLSSNLAKFGLKHVGILPMPQLEQMIVHLGNEERSQEERLSDAEKAESLYAEWKTKFPGVLE